MKCEVCRFSEAVIFAIVEQGKLKCKLHACLDCFSTMKRGEHGAELIDGKFWPGLLVTEVGQKEYNETVEQNDP